MSFSVLFLLILSLAIFLFHIQFPRNLNYDEFHYVPAAKKLMQLSSNSNPEHPPLAKYLIASSIAIGGDRPFGWRLLSSIFGAFSVLGIYFLGLSLFKSQTAAWAAAGMTLFNHLIFIHARVAMLDSFMITFLIWAIYCFFESWKVHDHQSASLKWLRRSGFFFALAIACKWTALFAWIFAGLLLIIVFALQKFGIRDQKMTNETWYNNNLYLGLRWRSVLLVFFVAPIGIYYICHLPLLFLKEQHYSLWDILYMPLTMYEGQIRVVKLHNYMSQWWQWPLIHRPMWFSFDREGSNQEWVRGVALIGNPFLMWSGLMMMGMTFYLWLKNRSRTAFLISFFYIALTFIWVIVPRKVSFYYYYLPAATLLPLAIVYVLKQMKDSIQFQWFFTIWIFLWPLLPLVIYPEGITPSHFMAIYFPLLAIAGLFIGSSLWRKKLYYWHQHWMIWTTFSITLGVFVYFYPLLSALKIPKDAYRYWMWSISWI